MRVLSFTKYNLTIIYLFSLSSSYGQSRETQPDSVAKLATSSYRYERIIHDGNSDGWCDLWCDLFSYDTRNTNQRNDTDGDGVSDYDEMIHFRSPFTKGLPEKHLSDFDIHKLREKRHLAQIEAKKSPPIPKSTKWKKEHQLIDLKKIPQREDLTKINEDPEFICISTCPPPSGLPLDDNDCDGLTNLQELAQGLPTLGVNTGLVPGVCHNFQTIAGENRLAVDFRCLELPDLTYGYQVQESVDLTNWNDVDMYANRTGITNIDGGNGMIDIVNIHTSLSPFTYPKTFMRVQFHNPWPPQPIQFANVTLNDIVSHARDNVLTILPDNTLHKGIYDTYSATTNSELARFSWTNRIRLTGVSFDDARTCTLISPKHVLMASHLRRLDNNQVYFHTKEGNVISRTILESKRTSPAAISNQTTMDISVGLLDQPITDIPFYKVLESKTNWNSYLANALVFITRHNHREALVRRVGSFASGPNGTRQITFLSDTEVPEYYEIGTDPLPNSNPNLPPFPVSGGDSGNPSFILIRGEPVLMHINSFANTKGPLIGDSEVYNQINQFMSDLGGGHQLVPIYLNP